MSVLHYSLSAFSGLAPPVQAEHLQSNVLTCMMAFVCRMAWLHNRYSENTFTIKDTIVVWWAGMMRGAVSVAMVYYRFDPRNEKDDKHAATIVVTTLQLVLYSTVGLGGLTGPLLKCLLPQQVH
jgi:NhaP-type Na+/H+ or K+/H+ antiporter